MSDFSVGQLVRLRKPERFVGRFWIVEAVALSCVIAPDGQAYPRFLMAEDDLVAERDEAGKPIVVHPLPGSNCACPVCCPAKYELP